MSPKDQIPDAEEKKTRRKNPQQAVDKSAAAARQQPHPAAIVQRTMYSPDSLTVQDVQQLQQAYGNAAVGQMLSQTMDRRKAQPGIPSHGAVVQREVDTSSSPSLPEYEEGEVPAWMDEGGVAEWAKEDYRRESRQTVICSMTPDRKIGSVYFGDEGRIRMTHAAGPAKEKHENLKTIQFNINEGMAVAEFKRAYPQYAQSKKFWSYFDRWLAKTLKDIRPENAPAWAKLVDSPEAAQNIEGSSLEDVKLFEIFKNINGKVEGWHPSRGAATKFETDKQTISVLQAAIRFIDGKGIVDPQARNMAFYNFVKSRLPAFADYMRRPDEVD